MPPILLAGFALVKVLCGTALIEVSALMCLKLTISKTVMPNKVMKAAVINFIQQGFSVRCTGCLFSIKIAGYF